MDEELKDKARQDILDVLTEPGFYAHSTDMIADIIIERLFPTDKASDEQ